MIFTILHSFYREIPPNTSGLARRRIFVIRRGVSRGKSRYPQSINRASVPKIFRRLPFLIAFTIFSAMRSALMLNFRKKPFVPSSNVCERNTSVSVNPGMNTDTGIPFSIETHSLNRCNAALDAQYAATPAKGQREEELPMLIIFGRPDCRKSGVSVYTAEKELVFNVLSAPPFS